MSSIVLTEGAAKKVAALKSSESNDSLMLRLYITGGGCSGFSYGFKFDESINDDDTQITKDGVIMLIDSLSIQYLEGSIVDYKESLMGSQFVVENPNATTTCGCGSSFSV
ncbi:MAG: iron-sulfur cluster insertion protein ErpA [Pseudomonadota bacterium]|nr:iron-sulfur cluster insertion protein ErpA [Pseudomonadota bacterium]